MKTGIIECRICDGIGVVELACKRHDGNCPCSTPEVECRRCDGGGRICLECGNPVSVSEPPSDFGCSLCQWEVEYAI